MVDNRDTDFNYCFEALFKVSTQQYKSKINQVWETSPTTVFLHVGLNSTHFTMACDPEESCFATAQNGGEEEWGGRARRRSETVSTAP